MLLDFHNLGILAPSIPETELHFQKTIHSIYLKTGILQWHCSVSEGTSLHWL